VGVSGPERRVPEGGEEAVLLGAECRHLPREVLDLLLKCGVRGRATPASTGCDLGDTVRTEGCVLLAALVLTGKNGLYFRG
jgi:hypothetical protein